MNFFDYPYPFLDYHLVLKGYIPWTKEKTPCSDNVFRENMAPEMYRLSRVQL